jgi:hypothetical protein
MSARMLAEEARDDQRCQDAFDDDASDGLGGGKPNGELLAVHQVVVRFVGVEEHDDGIVHATGGTSASVVALEGARLLGRRVRPQRRHPILPFPAFVERIVGEPLIEVDHCGDQADTAATQGVFVPQRCDDDQHHANDKREQARHERPRPDPLGSITGHAESDRHEAHRYGADDNDYGQANPADRTHSSLPLRGPPRVQVGNVANLDK